MKRAKHPPVVFIEWRDAATASSRWELRKDSIKTGMRVTQPISAAGFLLADERDTVVVSLLMNHHNDDTAHVLAIPRAMVVNMTQLLPARGYKAVKSRKDTGKERA